MTKHSQKTTRTPFPEFSLEGHQAFSGSDSLKFASELIRQIASATRTADASTEEDAEARVMAAYEALQKLAPRDELEGMLGVQMLATHNAALECLSRCMLENQPVQRRDYNLKHAAALMTLYERQLAAWDGRRERAARQISIISKTAKPAARAQIPKAEKGDQAALTAQPNEQEDLHAYSREGAKGKVRRK